MVHREHELMADSRQYITCLTCPLELWWLLQGINLLVLMRPILTSLPHKDLTSASWLAHAARLLIVTASECVQYVGNEQVPPSLGPMSSVCDPRPGRPVHPLPTCIHAWQVAMGTDEHPEGATYEHLRALKNVHALGDCCANIGQPLPALAQVRLGLATLPPIFKH